MKSQWVVNQLNVVAKDHDQRGQWNTLAVLETYIHMPLGCNSSYWW